jgi:hypothetical protein
MLDIDGPLIEITFKGDADTAAMLSVVYEVLAWSDEDLLSQGSHTGRSAIPLFLRYFRDRLADVCHRHDAEGLVFGGLYAFDESDQDLIRGFLENLRAL